VSLGLVVDRKIEGLLSQTAFRAAVMRCHHTYLSV